MIVTHGRVTHNTLCQFKKKKLSNECRQLMAVVRLIEHVTMHFSSDWQREKNCGAEWKKGLFMMHLGKPQKIKF